MQTKNIEDHVLAIQSYFKERTLAQDFEVTKVTENFINIKFDEKYELSIWIGNLPEYCEFWNGAAIPMPPNFLVPKFDENEKEQLHQICLKIRDEHQAEMAKKQIEQLEAKKKELEAQIANLNTQNK